MEIMKMNERDPQWKDTHDRNGYELLAEYQCWEEGGADTIEFTLLRRKNDRIVIGCIRLFDGIIGRAPSASFVARIFPALKAQLEKDNHPKVIVLTSRMITWIENEDDPRYKAALKRRAVDPKVKA